MSLDSTRGADAMAAPTPIMGPSGCLQLRVPKERGNGLLHGFAKGVVLC